VSTEGSSAAPRGKLSLVATPIGNLEDVTLRALRVLREADAVLAEDTRRSYVLLSHHGIRTRLVSVHEHTTPDKVAALADEIEAGARYALVTDAGSPLVSDPGAALLALCAARGLSIEPIPGPSAPIAALSVAGFEVPSFEFLGFLPRHGPERAETIERMRAQPGAIVLFESPHRLSATLAELASALGPETPAAVCRELTKRHEEVRRASLSALAEHFSGEVLGEITLVIAPDPLRGAPADVGEAELDAKIEAGLASGESAKDLSRRLAELLRLPKKSVYERILKSRRA
jgi:16S rRNA (cytidine1402-2'-O)-methyltransferase